MTIMKLIDKDKIIAEIERLRKEDGNPYFPSETADKYYARGVHFTCDGLVNFLDTIEVKESDLEKEIGMFTTKQLLNKRNHSTNIFHLTQSDVEHIAKHFFGCGLKAQKGE